MRVPVALVLALGLAACGRGAPPPPAALADAPPPPPVPPAQMAPICARPPEKAAFDVATLKSQLMLAALTCDARDQFNAFVAHYQHDLQGDEKSLNGFFSRAYGRQAQKQHDDFITQLANAQSELGTKAGVNFCKQNLGMFQDVMSLKSDADLPVYAAAKPLQRALAVQECAAAPAPVAKKPVARKIVARKHK